MSDVPALGARRMAPLTLETLPDLPEGCRACVRWELPEGVLPSEDEEHQRLEKEAWLSRLLMRWPSAGRVAWVDDRPAGYVMVAPTDMAPRSTTLASSPVSHDAALLVTGRVAPFAVGTGIGRMLVQGVAKDLTQRGFHAVEVFGARAGTGDAVERDEAGRSSRRCMLPADFALAVGFTVVADDPAVPRLRLELRSALDWREDVEAALDRLLATMSLSSS